MNTTYTKRAKKHKMKREREKTRYEQVENHYETNTLYFFKLYVHLACMWEKSIFVLAHTNEKKICS